MREDEVRMPPPGYRSAPQRRAAEARRRVLAAGGVGAVLLVCLGGYLASTGGGPVSVPVIQAPPGSVKVKPDDPGGLQVNAQTSALLGSNRSPAGANLAPAPEAPDPAALAATADQEQAPAASTAASAPSPVAASPNLAPSPATVAATPPSPTVSVPTVPETPAPAAAQQTALNMPPASASAAAVHNLAQENNPPGSTAARSHVRVQLAALGTEGAALHEWEQLTHRMPGLLNGRRPIFAEAHVNGHTFWRVRTSGFESVTEATRFCNDVRARGAACTVALF